MRKNIFLFRFIASSLFSAYVFLLFPQAGTQLKRTSAENWQEAQAECVMELHSRRVLYESNGDMRLPMASTTKILTCATVLDVCKNLQEAITIPTEAVGIEGSSVYLKAGEIYTVEDLLYGLMLRSGNDCATALALKFGGNLEKFSAKMNETAQKAGALASNFVNPHGLPCEGHYTTARDLSAITSYAMHNTEFCKIVSTQYYAPRHWKNKNKMLTLYEGGIGVKTGYTKQAGRCLVSAAKRGDMSLICTVLNCPTTYERSTKLLDDAFEAYDYVKILSAGDTLPLENAKNNVLGVVKNDYFYPLLKEERDLLEIKTTPLKNMLRRKKSEEIVGQFEIYLAKRLLFSGNLYKL